MVMMVTALAVMVMMFMIFVMVMMVAALAVVVVMFVLLVMVMMVTAFSVMMMFVFLVMVMMVTALAVMVVMFVFLVIVMVMMMSAYGTDIFILLHLLYLCFERGYVVHSLKKFFSFKFFPRSSDNCRLRIETLDGIETELQFIFVDTGRMAEYYALCFFYLILIEFTEVLQIHLAFFSVYYRSERRNFAVGKICRKHRFKNVAEFSDTRRLDKDSVGSIFRIYFIERFFEVAYERTTNTTAIHFVDLNTCFLEKTAVDTYVAELVFDKDYFLSFQRRGKKFFDKGRLSRTQKA